MTAPTTPPKKPDVWSEADYLPPATPKRHLTVEETLLVAVLHRGLLDFATICAYKAGEVRAPRDMHELDDAVRWVRSLEDHPFSFEYCCWRGLGLDPDLIRKTVEQNWRRFLTRDAAMIFHVDNTTC